MNNSRTIVQGILLASLLLFVGYYWVLIDWYKGMRQGSYAQEPLTMAIESGVLLAYGYLAYRFIQSRLIDNHSPARIQKEDSKTHSLRHAHGLLRKMTAAMTTKQAGVETRGELYSWWQR